MIDGFGRPYEGVLFCVESILSLRESKPEIFQ